MPCISFLYKTIILKPLCDQVHFTLTDSVILENESKPGCRVFTELCSCLGICFRNQHSFTVQCSWPQIPWKTLCHPSNWCLKLLSLQTFPLFLCHYCLQWSQEFIHCAIENVCPKDQISLPVLALGFISIILPNPGPLEENCKHMLTMTFLIKSVQLILSILCIMSHPEHYRRYEEQDKQYRETT